MANSGGNALFAKGSVDASELDEKEDHVRVFDASFALESSVELVWEVLTDYENIQNFQPGIETSVLLENLPNGDKRLEQQMVQRFLFLKKRMRLVVRIVEKPPFRIEFSILEGDFKTYDGAWIIDPNPENPQLRLLLRVEPSFSAPAPVLSHIVRTSGEKSLLSIIKEARRRSL